MAPLARRSVQKNNVPARRRLFAYVELKTKLQLCKNNKIEENKYRIERRKILSCKLIDLFLK